MSVVYEKVTVVVEGRGDDKPFKQEFTFLLPDEVTLHQSRGIREGEVDGKMHYAPDGSTIFSLLVKTW